MGSSGSTEITGRDILSPTNIFHLHAVQAASLTLPDGACAGTFCTNPYVCIIRVDVWIALRGKLHRDARQFAPKSIGLFEYG